MLLHWRPCDIGYPPLGGKPLTSQGLDLDNFRTRSEPLNFFGCTAEWKIGLCVVYKKEGKAFTPPEGVQRKNWKAKEKERKKRKSNPENPSKPISRSGVAPRNLVLPLSIVAFSAARHMFLRVEGKAKT